MHPLVAKKMPLALFNALKALSILAVFIPRRRIVRLDELGQTFVVQSGHASQV